MSLKDNWKETGVGFGNAFKNLGNSLTMKGSWRDTGKGFGHAFASFGKAVIKSASTAATKADEWANSDDE